jgi:hypothetical protein
VTLEPQLFAAFGSAPAWRCAIFCSTSSRRSSAALSPSCVLVDGGRLVQLVIGLAGNRLDPLDLDDGLVERLLHAIGRRLDGLARLGNRFLDLLDLDRARRIAEHDAGGADVHPGRARIQRDRADDRDGDRRGEKQFLRFHDSSF